MKRRPGAGRNVTADEGLLTTVISAGWVASGPIQGGSLTALDRDVSVMREVVSEESTSFRTFEQDEIAHRLLPAENE